MMVSMPNLIKSRREIFIISDTHFGHENIIKYCDRPFKNAEEMDEKILENWNSVVKPGDKVYHLGDVYFPARKSEGYWGTFFSRLNGQKRLILGNHDDGKNRVLQNTFHRIVVWRMFPEFGLLLTHVPVHHTALRRGATGNEKNPDSLRNVHGHIHQNASPSGPGSYMNVSVEQINYTPVNIETLRIR